ncbi:MAG: extracellular solute-binding protein family 1 [Bacilli bacterium]|nr:extracellular solute-binding protein family 1 [Bacilli bacterium]
MKMNRSKMVACLACLTLIFTIISGCSSNSTTTESAAPATKVDAATAAPAPTATPKVEPVTLSIMVDNNSQAQPGFEEVAKIAEQKYNIKISFEIKPAGAEGDNLVKTRLATGDMTDILNYNAGSLFLAISPEKNFADLTNEPFAGNIMDSFKSVVTANGKLYGVPAGSSMAGGWLYNKKVYADLGLSVPKTWAELMANNVKIKAAGKTAVISSFKDAWTSQLLVLADYYNVASQDKTFVDNYTANKAKFATSPAALRGFEKLGDIYKGGFMNKDYQATTLDGALKMLVEGTGVQYPMLSFALTTINANYPDKLKDIGVFAQPGDSADQNGLTVWMPGGLYIYAKSPKIDAAKKFFEVYLSPEGQAAFASKVKAEGPYVVKGVTLPADAYPGVKDMVPYFDAGKTAPALEFLSPVKGPSLEQITVEVGSGIVSPAEGAKKYDKDVEKQAKQLKLPGW